MTETDMLNIIQSKNFEYLWYQSDSLSTQIIQNKLQEIPAEFFEPRICVNKEKNTNISLIQFSSEINGLSNERKRGMMEQYHIDPYDMQRLQTIIDSIKIAREYGKDNTKNEARLNSNEESYGFSLSSNDRLGKAYPLWLAYLFADSKNPYEDISAKLKEDGMNRKYRPETVMELMEHTNELMKGKSISEKKNFYIHSINDILDRPVENLKKRDILEI